MSSLQSNSVTQNREEILLSLWNKSGESNPNTASPWTYKRPTVITSPNSKFSALLIGINHYYRSDTLKPLQGAVADALAFKEYLELDLGIASDNITTLLNGAATRAAITNALLDLKNDARTSKGDPIFIFYAGYGGEASFQNSSSAKERCIVPYDYLQQDRKGQEVEAIPHGTLATLISQIVESKGDNVTIVLDCSYAPFAAENHHEFSTTSIRSTPLKPLKTPSGLHANAWATNGEQLPYMLLSACNNSEAARETFGRGNYSKAILNLLRRSSPHELAYLDIISRIDQIPGQTPQCIGSNKARTLFNGKVAVTQRTCFHLTKSEEGFVLHAGTIHGVASGAEFTIYSNDDLSFSSPLGVMNIATLGAFSTTLELPPDSDSSKFPESALALQTKVGTLEDIRFYIPLDDRLLPCYEALVELMRGNHADLENVFLVDSPKNAHIEIAEENGKAVFLLRDQRITQYGLTRLCEGVELTVESIIPVLKAAAHYYWKINRTNADPDISTKVQVEFFKLEDFSPDDFGGGELVPTGTSLYHNNTVEFVVDEDCPYGLNLINNGPHDLYPYMFYFDNSDLSIGAYYQPSMGGGNSPPLKKNGGTLSIGYGSGGASPFAYYLRDNQDLDVGFLKLFLSTQPVDLSNIPQSTPFETTRSASKLVKSTVDTWSTILIPVIQHRYPPNSKPCPRCGFVMFDDANSNVYALKLQNDELKGERDVLATSLAREKRKRDEELRHFDLEVKNLQEEIARLKSVPAGSPRKPARKGSLLKALSGINLHTLKAHLF